LGLRGRDDHAHEPVAQDAAEEGLVRVRVRVRVRARVRVRVRVRARVRVRVRANRLEGHARLGDGGAHGGAAQRAEGAW